MQHVAARLRRAAFELFESEGYDATTVDRIAEHAGVGRTTFFRHFGSKEEVIFPDHSEVLGRVQARLLSASVDTTALAVTDAARLVLRRYLDEGDLARTRYRLTRSVPSLRAREIAHMQQYMREFREFVRGWTGEAPGADLRAELIAGAIVTAHNHVLRRWLRGLTETPEADFEEAMVVVTRLHLRTDAEGRRPTTVLVIEADADAESVAERVRGALAAD